MAPTTLTVTNVSFAYQCWDQPDAAEMLLSSGADVSVMGPERLSVLALAVKQGNIKCVQILLKYNADVNIQVSESMRIVIIQIMSFCCIFSFIWRGYGNLNP